MPAVNLKWRLDVMFLVLSSAVLLGSLYLMGMLVKREKIRRVFKSHWLNISLIDPDHWVIDY